MRPWVPPEHALVISSAHINPDGYAEAEDKAEWPPPADLPAHLMKPSFLTLEMQVGILLMCGGSCRCGTRLCDTCMPGPDL